MKRAAAYALHYGKEYLAWSIRSIQAAVDEVHIFYTATPSYGHRNPSAVCPDTEEELHAEAQRFAEVPLIWHRTKGFQSEGAHRSFMRHTLEQAGHQMMLVVDADELWDPATACSALQHVELANQAGRWLVPFHNFWRSIFWSVTDQFRPVRILDLRHPESSDAHLSDFDWPVLHFGYAQSVALVRYKWTCHGHQAELRPGWLERFENWDPLDEDLHPVALGVWPRARPTDERTLSKLTTTLLHDHPYIHQEIIR